MGIMEIREYKSTDIGQIARLFHDTVHAVNHRDYTPEQLRAWATGRVDEEAWDAGRFGMSEVLFSLSGSTARENASTLIDMWNHLDPYSEDNLFTLRD